MVSPRLCMSNWAAVHQMTAEAIEADEGGHDTATALVALLYATAVMWSETPWLASVDDPVAHDERTFRYRVRGHVRFLTPGRGLMAGLLGCGDPLHLAVRIRQRYYRGPWAALDRADDVVSRNHPGRPWAGRLWRLVALCGRAPAASVS